MLPKRRPDAATSFAKSVAKSVANIAGKIAAKICGRGIVVNDVVYTHLPIVGCVSVWHSTAPNAPRIWPAPNMHLSIEVIL